MSRFRNQMGRFRNQAGPDSETKTAAPETKTADSETKSDDSETKPGDSATTIQKPKQPIQKPMQKPSQTIQKPSQTMVSMGWRGGGVWGGREPCMWMQRVSEYVGICGIWLETLGWFLHRISLIVVFMVECSTLPLKATTSSRTFVSLKDEDELVEDSAMLVWHSSTKSFCWSMCL